MYLHLMLRFVTAGVSTSDAEISRCKILLFASASRCCCCRCNSLSAETTTSVSAAAGVPVAETADNPKERSPTPAGNLPWLARLGLLWRCCGSLGILGAYPVTQEEGCCEMASAKGGDQSAVATPSLQRQQLLNKKLEKDAEKVLVRS
jgi:hypothetical protein